MWFWIILGLFFFLLFNAISGVVGYFAREPAQVIKVKDLLSKPEDPEDVFWSRTWWSNYWCEPTNNPGMVRVRLVYGPYGWGRKNIVIDEEEVFWLDQNKTQCIYGKSKMNSLLLAELEVLKEKLGCEQRGRRVAEHDRDKLKHRFDEEVEKQIKVGGDIAEKSRSIYKTQKTTSGGGYNR